MLSAAASLNLVVFPLYRACPMCVSRVLVICVGRADVGAARRRSDDLFVKLSRVKPSMSSFEAENNTLRLSRESEISPVPTHSWVKTERGRKILVTQQRRRTTHNAARVIQPTRKAASCGVTFSSFTAQRPKRRL